MSSRAKANKVRIWCWNFQSRFVPAIRSGRKLQTIRADRKDESRPKPGDEARLYTGLRTRSATLITRRLVCAVQTIAIDWGSLREPIWLNGEPLSGKRCGELACADGFQDMGQMREFFQYQHGPRMDGIVVRWSVEELMHEDSDAA